jgi:dTDP-4-dehydrorhamnose reductase
MTISIIGSSGLVGSRIVELLKNSYSFIEYNSSTGFDITNPTTLSPLSQDSSEWVILLAAKADVDGCEADKAEGENGDAWKINVLGVQNIAKICHESGKKLLYISTDFVFDGTKPETEAYTEEDTPNPINWYGYTKWKGEEMVIQSGASYCIARLSYPYRSSFEKKKDFVRAIEGRLREQQPVVAVTDHLFTPTFIDDFVQAIDTIIQSNLQGIYHTVGNQFLTPYEAAQLIAQEFELDNLGISSTNREEYFKGKADRPFNLALNNDKINALGVRMKRFDEGLQEMKHQLTNSK